MPDQALHLDEWRQSVLTQWTDSRIVPAQWVDTHIWFFMHLYADLAKWDLTLDGFSVKHTARDTCLILKLTREDTPYVVFIWSRDTTHCMAKAKRQLRNGGFDLKPDQFR